MGGKRHTSILRFNLPLGTPHTWQELPYLDQIEQSDYTNEVEDPGEVTVRQRLRPDACLTPLRDRTSPRTN